MANISRPRLLVLASGTGSTFDAIAAAVAAGALPARLVGLITDRPAEALKRAAERGVEGLMVEYRKGDEAWPTRLVAAVDSFRPDFIVLAGFLRKIPAALVDSYRGRIVNTHPSLLPKYGGKGLYGGRVHEAVIAAGEKETGVTLHHVTENYDEGAPIAQIKITIQPGETARELEARVKEIEKKFLLEELKKLLAQIG